MRKLIYIALFFLTVANANGQYGRIVESIQPGVEVEFQEDIPYDDEYYYDYEDEVMDSAVADSLEGMEGRQTDKMIAALSSDDTYNMSRKTMKEPTEEKKKGSSYSLEEIITGLLGFAILYYGGKFILNGLASFLELFDSEEDEDTKRKKKKREHERRKREEYERREQQKREEMYWDELHRNN